MHPVTDSPGGFKRQVVFRIGVEEWPLLEAASRDYGSIQKAVIAGLRALAADRQHPVEPTDGQPATASPAQATAQPNETPISGRDGPADEITTREAARLLGLKTSTLSSYVRSGRLPGRYDPHLPGGGWLTSRHAVERYRLGRG